MAHRVLAVLDARSEERCEERRRLPAARDRDDVVLRAVEDERLEPAERRRGSGAREALREHAPGVRDEAAHEVGAGEAEGVAHHRALRESEQERPLRIGAIRSAQLRDESSRASRLASTSRDRSSGASSCGRPRTRRSRSAAPGRAPSRTRRGSAGRALARAGADPFRRCRGRAGGAGAGPVERRPRARGRRARASRSNAKGAARGAPRRRGRVPNRRRSVQGRSVFALGGTRGSGPADRPPSCPIAYQRAGPAPGGGGPGAACASFGGKGDPKCADSRPGPRWRSRAEPSR